jgi:hypothetical protein
MPTLIKYERATGRIDGGWVSLTTACLEAQRQPDDATWAYLRLETEEDLAQITARRYVHADLVLAKQALTLTADPSPFAADGNTTCHITVAPFVPCTLLLDGQPYALTEADPVLALTADSPRRFVVELEPMVTAWADPLTVEAQ